MTKSFDFKRFLEDRWGDPDKLVAFLHAYGHADIKRAAVNQWFRRELVPTEKFALLLSLLRTETGGNVAVEDYMR